MNTLIYIRNGDVLFNDADPDRRPTNPGIVAIIPGRVAPVWCPDYFLPETTYSAKLPDHPGWWNNGAIDIWVRPGYDEPMAVVNGRDFCKVSGLTPYGWRPGRRVGSNPTTIHSDNGKRTFS